MIDTLQKTNEITPFYRWVMLLISALFVAYNSFQMHMFNTLAPYLMQSFGIQASTLGVMSSVYFIGLLLISLPIGLLLDRYSNLVITLVGLLICITGLALFATATSVLQAEIGRFIAGVGGSSSYLCTLILATRWLKAYEFARASAIIAALNTLGAILSQKILHSFIIEFGWHNAIYFVVFVGVIIFILIGIFVHDTPEKKIMNANHDSILTHLRAIPNEIKQVIIHKQVWLASIFNWGLLFPTAILGSLFGQLYFMHSYHLIQAEAGFIISLFFLGTLIGLLCNSWISDLLSRRKPVMIYGAAGSLLCLLMLFIPITFSQTILSLLMIGLGFFSSVGIISHALITENIPSKLIGCAQAFAGIIIMSAYVISQPLVGTLLDLTQHDYQIAFIVLPITGVIALVIAFLIGATYAKRPSLG